MKEWEIYLKKEGCKDYLGTVVAKSPQEAIELYFEPEDIQIHSETSLEIIDKSSPSNVFEYAGGKLTKVKQ